jgi:hypothetical protein
MSSMRQRHILDHPLAQFIASVCKAGGASLMNPQNAAGCFLCQFIDSAPQTRYVEIALVQSYDEEIGFLPAQKTDDRLHPVFFDQVTVKVDAISASESQSFVLQKAIGLLAIVLKNAWKRDVRGACVSGVCGKVRHGRYGVQLGMQDFRQPDGRDESPLCFR